MRRARLQQYKASPAGSSRGRRKGQEPGERSSKAAIFEERHSCVVLRCVSDPRGNDPYEFRRLQIHLMIERTTKVAITATKATPPDGRVKPEAIQVMTSVAAPIKPDRMKMRNQLKMNLLGSHWSQHSCPSTHPKCFNCSGVIFVVLLHSHSALHLCGPTQCLMEPDIITRA